MERLEKAFDLLEVFLKHEGELGISQLANLSKLNVSTAYRLASTLVKRGYLDRRSDRAKYSLGLKFLEFSSAVSKRVRVREMALPFLKRLNEVVNESVNLAVLDRGEAIYIEHIESSHGLRMFTKVGNRVPLHCTGVGKIFLAYMTEEDLEESVGSKGLFCRRTQNAIKDFTELKRELSVIRRDGIAIDNEEMEVGVKCVAAPVRDVSGNVVAAISVSGPSARLTNRRVEELKLLIKSCGLEISRAIGYQDKQSLFPSSKQEKVKLGQR